jgi:hypothetical protein
MEQETQDVSLDFADLSFEDCAISGCCVLLARTSVDSDTYICIYRDIDIYVDTYASRIGHFIYEVTAHNTSMDFVI